MATHASIDWGCEPNTDDDFSTRSRRRQYRRRFDAALLDDTTVPRTLTARLLPMPIRQKVATKCTTQAGEITFQCISHDLPMPYFTLTTLVSTIEYFQ